MNNSIDSNSFDDWAHGYEDEVAEADAKNEFPFAGYGEIMKYIYDKISQKPDVSVLDIGIGTGALSAKLYEMGANITGVDFSDEMLHIARQRMPNANLLKWDFSKGLPDEAMSGKFDFIISTYAMHHLTDAEKLRLISLSRELLAKGGELIIGDIGFIDKREMEDCEREYALVWDDEFYFVMSELKRHLGDNVNFRKFSYCSVLLEISKPKRGR